MKMKSDTSPLSEEISRSGSKMHGGIGGRLKKTKIPSIYEVRDGTTLFEPYDVSDYKTFSARCSCGFNCELCVHREGLYRVCPGCGGDIGIICSVAECECGTLLYLCSSDDIIVVSGFAIPSAAHKLATTKEDII